MRVRRERRYDRAEMVRVLQTEGLEAAKARWGPMAYQIITPIARALGVIPPYFGTEKKHVWKPEWNALLGTKDDMTLAGELVIPVGTIRMHRKLLGIPRADTRWQAIRKQWAERLSTITDEQLAGPLERFAIEEGIPYYRLTGERRRRGVEANDNRGRPGMLAGRLMAMRIAVVHVLQTEFPGVTLEEMGEVMGVSRERVRQVIMGMKGKK